MYRVEGRNDLIDMTRLRDGLLASAAQRVASWHDAEDLTQRTLVRLNRQMERGHAGDVVQRAYATLHNEIRNHRRTLKRRREDLRGLDLDNEVNLAAAKTNRLTVPTPTTPDAYMFGLALTAAVRGLPEPEREAFVLTVMRGLTAREAAQVLGTSHTTVLTRANSARSILKEELFS